MSLDYPFYEELKRRKHRAARWWRLGDSLYYLGLILGVLSIIAFLFYFIIQLLNNNFSWKYLLILFVFLMSCFLVFYTGASLKKISYQIAKKDGIDINDY